MGTLIDCAHADSVIALFGKAKAKGNCCWMVVTLAGCRHRPDHLCGCRPECVLSREEIFGPVLVVTRFTSEEQRYSLPTTASTALARRYGRATLPRAPHEPPPEGWFRLRQ